MHVPCSWARMSGFGLTLNWLSLLLNSVTLPGYTLVDQHPASIPCLQSPRDRKYSLPMAVADVLRQCYLGMGSEMPGTPRLTFCLVADPSFTWLIIILAFNNEGGRFDLVPFTSQLTQCV